MLVSYRTAVQTLVTRFHYVKYEHTKCSTNKYVDALVTLASKVPMQDFNANMSVQITRRTMPYTTLQLIVEDMKMPDDWHATIKAQLTHPKKFSMTTLKYFISMHNTLYYKRY